jgi:hypothetical protein
MIPILEVMNASTVLFQRILKCIVVVGDCFGGFVTQASCQVGVICVIQLFSLSLVISLNLHLEIRAPNEVMTVFAASEFSWVIMTNEL